MQRALIGQPLSHRDPAAATTSSVRPDDDSSMHAVINRAVPNATVLDLRAVASLRPRRLYNVRISDGTSLVLAIAPPPMAKLLRSEQASVSSEAAVLRWLGGLDLDKSMLQERTPEPDELRQRNPSDASPVEQSPNPRTVVEDVNSLVDITRFLPRLLAHANAATGFGMEYNVMKPTAGTPISDIEPPLTTAERRAVDFQTGQFCRRVCGLVSPTGRFGPAFAVLPSLSTPPKPFTSMPPAARDANARMVESKGVASWSTAFHSMLEAVLRDGEDMAVMLGYAAIRRHFRRLEPALDAVISPRLVAVDAGDDLNTLVLRTRIRPRSKLPAPRRRTDGKTGGSGPLRDTGNPESGTESGEQEDDDDDDEEEDDDTSDKAGKHHDSSRSEEHYDVTVTGMKDWSNFIFGDPLFATIFSKNTTSEFVRGFSGSSDVDYEAAAAAATVSTGKDSADSKKRSGSWDFPPNLVEDVANAPTRLLLYECYHTVTHLVRGFYRPQRDSSKRELEARKTLNDILARLEKIADPVVASSTSSSRRLSGEVSPPKRAKSEDT